MTFTCIQLRLTTLSVCRSACWRVFEWSCSCELQKPRETFERKIWKFNFPKADEGCSRGFSAVCAIAFLWSVFSFSFDGGVHLTGSCASILFYSFLYPSSQSCGYNYVPNTTECFNGSQFGRQSDFAGVKRARNEGVGVDYALFIFDRQHLIRLFEGFKAISHKTIKSNASFIALPSLWMLIHTRRKLNTSKRKL